MCRIGRPAGCRHGSDWFIGKSHDPTFAPLGPYIVPKAFVADPQKMPIKFTLSGKVMQDSNTDRMTHNVYRLISLRLAHHDAAAGRHHLYWQPCRRRHRAGDTDVHEGGRCLRMHDRQHRDTHKPGRCRVARVAVTSGSVQRQIQRPSTAQKYAEPIENVAKPAGCPAVSVFGPIVKPIIATTDTSVLQRELHQAPCIAVAINGPAAKNR